MINKKKDLSNIIKKRIRNWYIKMDEELNMEEQAVGWAAIFSTFLVIWIIFKVFYWCIK